MQGRDWLDARPFSALKTIPLKRLDANAGRRKRDREGHSFRNCFRKRLSRKHHHRERAGSLQTLTSGSHFLLGITLTRQAQADPRTAHEFIAIALTEPDELKAWEAVVKLHFRGTNEVLDAACQSCVSHCSQEKTLGANILGQRGVPERTFPKESVAVLLKLLELEKDEGVLDACCIALVSDR